MDHWFKWTFSEKCAIFGKEKQGCRFALEHFRWDPARLAPFGRFRQLQQRIPVRCRSVVSEFSQASLETRTVKELKKMCKDRNPRSRLELRLPWVLTQGRLRAGQSYQLFGLRQIDGFSSFSVALVRHVSAWNCGIEGPIFNKPMFDHVWPEHDPSVGSCKWKGRKEISFIGYCRCQKATWYRFPWKIHRNSTVFHLV